MVFGRVAQLTPGSVSLPFDFRFKLVKTRAGGIFDLVKLVLSGYTLLFGLSRSCGKRNGQQV